MTDRAFTHRHLLLLTPLANYAAIAIENAPRYQQTHQLLGDAYTLFDIAGLFTETRNNVLLKEHFELDEFGEAVREALQATQG